MYSATPDNILKSLYLLDYIDSLPLRQNFQRALNRGESYHQLRRAISYANFGKLRFKSELEQQLWSECGRLIANCILYYNASILSTVLAHRESSGNVEGIEVLKQISPMAWQHINLYSRYSYTQITWGRAQRNTYLTQIDAAFQLLAMEPQLGKSCEDLRPGYRKYPVGKHLIFYHQLADGLEIIRVLHQRMDIEARFADE